MADIRMQKLEDYVQQLISEEFTTRTRHLKTRQENEHKTRRKQKKMICPKKHKKDE
ncbi:MAG: hypothetical protein R6U27_16560 [Desulfobacterales bacterium]